MTAALFQRAVVLLSFWLSAVHPTPCDLSIYPVHPVVPFGGSVTLNCTSSCANDTMLKWESSSQGEIQEAGSWTTASFANITDWEFQPVCFGDPTKVPAMMPVYLYQLSSPDIYFSSDIMAGHRYTVVCNISSLKVRDKVPHHINISLSSGGHILNGSQGILSVEYTSVARFDQDGDKILCEACLELGEEVLKKTANSTMKVYGTSRNWVIPVVVLVVVVLAVGAAVCFYRCRK